MRRFNLTGQVFGRLTAIKPARDIGNLAAWGCRCECGNETVVATGKLRRGTTRSCGCLQREKARTHGLSAAPIYAAWRAMVDRCHKRNYPAYPNYGGRGITVCDRWRHGADGLSAVECFIADMGPRPSAKHSIDRIDNDLGYSPDNCRWGTPRQQSNNKRTNRLVTAFGDTMTVSQWAERCNIHPETLRTRLDHGGDPELCMILVEGLTAWTDHGRIAINASP